MDAGRALVTGAGKRLGRAMALYLAGRGWDVAVHYGESRAEADEVVAEILAMGRSAAVVQANLLDEAATQVLVQRSVEALGGPLTCLINNASIFEYDDLGTATRTSWDRAIESNLRAPFVLTQRFAEQAPPAGQDERGEAVASALIVNMLDQRMRKLTPAFASYTVAKMGLWALTRTSAMGLAPAIRVNGIGPGPTLQGAHQSAEHFAGQRAATILQRGSNPEDITAALGFLLEANSVTGQLICADGGQHLVWRTPDIQGLD